MKTHSYASIVGALIEDGLLPERREVICSRIHQLAKDLGNAVAGFLSLMLLIGGMSVLASFMEAL